MSKRQEIKERRAREAQTQRLIFGGLIIFGALAIAFVLFWPVIEDWTRPPEQVKSITPVERPMASKNSMGDPNAPVKIDVWEDFQCPACAQYSREVETKIAETYVATGKVYYTFHFFPFIDENSINKESDQSASASMCAAEQERFWDYHDILFENWDGENEGAFSDRRLLAFAESLSLDMTAFKACFEEGRYMDQINKDLRDGQALGVTGTPSVFVNGQQIMPGYIPSFEAISEAVEAELNK